jgi:hypothetical protein
VFMADKRQRQLRWHVACTENGQNALSHQLNPAFSTGGLRL